MPNGVSARRTVTRDRLADAAVAIFAERGVLGPSVEELCEAAGFTRGAFYSNFSSRNELCIAVVERRSNTYLEILRTAVAELTTLAMATPLELADMVRFGVNAFVSAQNHDRAAIMASIELRLHAARDDEFKVGYLALTARGNAHFLAILRDAADHFGYRLSIEPAVAVSILEGVFEMTKLIDLLADERAVHRENQVEMLTGMLVSMFTKA